MLTDRDMIGLESVTPEYTRQQYFLCFPRTGHYITGIWRPRHNVVLQNGYVKKILERTNGGF